MRRSKDNAFSFRKTSCQLCGEQVSDRKSEAIPGDDDSKFVLFKSEAGSVVTRKAMPRQHRKGEGCRGAKD